MFYIVFYDTSLKPFGFTKIKNGFKTYFIFLLFIFFSFYSMVFNENNSIISKWKFVKKKKFWFQFIFFRYILNRFLFLHVSWIRKLKRFWNEIFVFDEIFETKFFSFTKFLKRNCDYQFLCIFLSRISTSYIPFY